MKTVSSLPAVAAVLALISTSSGLAGSPAQAALLIEGMFGQEALRIVIDEEKAEADVTFGGKRHVLELGAGRAHRIEADGSRRPAEVMAKAAAPKPKIEPWGPGPSIAGHASVYHVMKLEDEICGELLISPWMKPFVDPAVEALSILERIKGEAGIRDTGLDGACGDLPFSSYAMAGWPLMAGGVTAPIFLTETISFSYTPSGDELSASN